jgi:pyocin large subunit-like protein
LAAALGGAAALALSACDNGPSAVAGKQAAGTQMAANASATGGDAYTPSAPEGPSVDHRKDPVKMVDGLPMWSASRKFSAQENAERAFERNGADFGAGSLDAFVKKAHAFVSHPPKGAETVTRRNGDVLIYDPKANIFAVANKEGAPRTMFHPDDGRAYWEKQKASAANPGRRARRGDDET